MRLNKSRRDRAYLYGRLVATAEQAAKEADDQYDVVEKLVDARRYAGNVLAEIRVKFEREGWLWRVSSRVADEYFELREAAKDVLRRQDDKPFLTFSEELDSVAGYLLEKEYLTEKRLNESRVD
jgi:hypothetical protein